MARKLFVAFGVAPRHRKGARYSEPRGAGDALTNLIISHINERRATLDLKEPSIRMEAAHVLAHLNLSELYNQPSSLRLSALLPSLRNISKRRSEKYLRTSRTQTFRRESKGTI
ncbi:unnamed protein product, partial [Iphiclides podalirius]